LKFAKPCSILHSLPADDFPAQKLLALEKFRGFLKSPDSHCLLDRIFSVE
jgi:hypothetical protein